MSSFREIVNTQLRSSGVLAAIAAALDAKVSRTQMDPALATRVEELLLALGLDSSVAGLTADEARQVLAEIRFFVLLDNELLSGAAKTGGWTFDNTAILGVGGDVAAGFAQILTYKIAPNLDGLQQRLASGAGVFLDVGVGAAGLAIAMAQLWPTMRVVGIDPWVPSLRIAKDRVAVADLADRIDLRELAVEQLADKDSYDLAWIPSVFLPESSIAPACERVFRALKPGGWLLFAMAAPGKDPVAAALVRMRTTLWGGAALAPEQVQHLLVTCGFNNVRALPSPPGSVMAAIAAQRSA